MKFAVTSITPNFSCEDRFSSYNEVPEGMMLLEFSVDAEMADSFLSDDSSNSLHNQHWGVIDADGYYDQSPDTAYCGTEWNLGSLHPGTKARGQAVFVVPEDAVTLRLGRLDGQPGWEWAIPSA